MAISSRQTKSFGGVVRLPRWAPKALVTLYFEDDVSLIKAWHATLTH